MPRKTLAEAAATIDGPKEMPRTENAVAGLKKHLVEGATRQLTLTKTGQDLLREIERIENLIAEQKALASDVNEIKHELKGKGFDMKAVGDLIKLRAMGEIEAKERLQILATYAASIGLDIFPSD
jgi:uncharacterized protein (UPF0335 family)